MQSATLIAVLTVFSLFLCLCHGAPPGESSKSASKSPPYSPDEEWFIINEMRRYPGKWLPIWGQDMWIEILNQHSKMKEASGRSIFPLRTVNGLSLYFQRKMLRSKGKVPLPDDLIARIPKSVKEKLDDYTGPTDSSQNENQNVSGAAQLRESINPKSRFTPEEDRFIINFIKTYPMKRKPVFGLKIWNEAAKQLREIRKSNPTGFPEERLGSALRGRFRRLSANVINKRHGTTEIRREYHQLLDPERTIYYRYTEEEDQFIIEELLKPTCTSLHSLTSWNKIKAQHDLKVQSKSPGFDRYRSALSMKKHTAAMLKGKQNQVPPAIKEKFSRHFSESQGDTSRESHSSGETEEAGHENIAAIWDLEFGDEFNIEDAQDVTGEWDGMIKELLEAPFDIDFDNEDQ